MQGTIAFKHTHDEFGDGDSFVYVNVRVKI